MNQRLLTVLLFAVGIAGSASFVVYRLVASQMQSHQQAAPTGNLVVATHDMEVGALIKDADVKAVSWSNSRPEHAITRIQDAVGRGAIANIYKDEPVVDGRLAPIGAGAGLAATIPMGKRAVALRVNEVVGLAGFVMPGMRVDVLISGNLPGAGQNFEGTLSRTVLQNIQVLSAGQKIERNSDGKPEAAQVVNLLVTPEQAETLSLASSETKVQLVLRNPLDTKEEDTQGTSVATLFSKGGRPQPVRKVSPTRVGHPGPLKLSSAVGKSSANVLIAAKSKSAPPPVSSIEVFNGGHRAGVQEIH